MADYSAHTGAAGEYPRTLVVGPYLKARAERTRRRSGALLHRRATEARLSEAAGLARAISLDVVGTIHVSLGQVRPAAYLGKGKVAELGTLVKKKGIELVVMDCALSPVQQRNLEIDLSAKVIDRTGLILEIFGQRARTREGSLQVELAHLAYQRSRLVRSWTHLGRQRGGFGFLGGPGETQIEMDRRLIQERITRIERELEDVKRTRGLHRRGRHDVPYPLVALVGYTNAGKSTLFNRLAKAGVIAADMLFATLDPTIRGVALPHGQKVMLSDTVGFISDLPTMLVSSFRATLEEVLEADLILHVRDVSHADSAAQNYDVQGVLRELGIEPQDRRLIEVWNKVDLLDEHGQGTFLRNGESGARPVLVSAITGFGISQLLTLIEDHLSSSRLYFHVEVPADAGQELHWAYENAEVLDRWTSDGGITHLDLRVGPERIDQLRRLFPCAKRTARLEPPAHPAVAPAP